MQRATAAASCVDGLTNVASRAGDAPVADEGEDARAGADVGARVDAGGADDVGARADAVASSVGKCTSGAAAFASRRSAISGGNSRTSVSLGRSVSAACN